MSKLNSLNVDCVWIDNLIHTPSSECLVSLHELAIILVSQRHTQLYRGGNTQYSGELFSHKRTENTYVTL